MILDSLKTFIDDNDLQDSKIAVACSGGVDSLTLLDALSKVHPKELILCLHLDHGWQESSKSAHELVKKYCEDHNISFNSKTYKTGEMNKSESEARKARYEFFQEACNKEGVTDLFLAHNLNDHVETILFRVFRGTGTAGLRGIKKKRDLGALTLLRPFLETTREEIEDYAKKNKLSFFEDLSNQDTNYARNRIRHNILPEALKLNQKVLNNVVQLTKIISEEQEFFSKELDKVLIALGDLPWELSRFRDLARAMQRKVLEKVFCPNIEFVNDFMEAITEGGFHRINFKKDHYFTIKQKKIYLE